MILSYSLISSIILIFGYISYRLLMAGQSQHALNRGILLTIFGISLIAPLIIITGILHNSPEISTGGTIEIGELTGAITDHTAAKDLRHIWGNIKDTAFLIFSIGAIGTAIYFLIGLFLLWRIILRGEKKAFVTFTLILIDDSCKTSPFSWGRSIVMTHKDYEEFGDMILLHEHAHLRQRHWIDLILAYSTICLQWYNPVSWAMREELKDVHEYQADEMVVEMEVDRKEYQMLLLQKAVGYRYQSLANSLNHSKLKKRVTMMYKEKTSLRRRLFALAIVPAIGAGIAVTAIPSVAEVLESFAESSSASLSETPAAAPKEREVYVTVETPAEYPGGMDELIHYLIKNVRYPEAAMKANIQGRVIVKFVVEVDGTITNAEIQKGVSPELDEEALRVVNSMPKWTPGKVGGKDVASGFVLPIQFRLQNDNPKEENQNNK